MIFRARASHLGVPRGRSTFAIIPYPLSTSCQPGPVSSGKGASSAIPEQLLSGRKPRPRGPNGGEASKPARERSGTHGRVLLFGRHRELALYRAAVLQHSGFRVLTPRTRQEALDAVRAGDFDAAILSYTLSADTVEELAEMLRQHCPTCPLITIAQERTVDRRIAPDAIVLADDGPQALLATLHHVLSKGVQ